MARAVALLFAHLVSLLAFVAPAPAADPAGPIALTPGLSFTSTTEAGLQSSAGSLASADTETVYQVTELTADTVKFRFVVSGGTDEAAGDLLAKVKKRTFDRYVKRSDLQSATRLTVLFSSDDPTMLPGQTFAGTSAAVVSALNSAGQVAFVLGVNEPEAGLGMLAPAGNAMQGNNKSGAPAMIAGFMASLGTARHYYRGTLSRVGNGSEPFSVLLNGARTAVPALHVKGDMTFNEKQIAPELWWLDDPSNPITLKWSITTGGATTYEVVTRIDTPPKGAGPQDNPLESLAGKRCRAELSGVYFTTGSAVVLDASMPALSRFAAVLAQHPDWKVVIEGHTDNIGSAEYNLDLSSRRAQAVRDVLITQLHVSSTQLEAKGYGLTRPVEPNATVQGRAHNRRVEVARKCP